jgi:hypothetical protein
MLERAVEAFAEGRSPDRSRGVHGWKIHLRDFHQAPTSSGTLRRMPAIATPDGRLQVTETAKFEKLLRSAGIQEMKLAPLPTETDLEL